MSKARIHKIALAVVGVVVLAAVAAVFGLVLRQWPLTGDMRHDFGEIWIDDLEAVKEHTFTLVNESGEPVLLTKAIASCGCTAVKPGATLIEPGASFELPVRFTLKGTGHKQSTIDLLMEVGGEEVEQVLAIEGVGRRRKTVWASNRVMRLRRGIDVSYRFVTEVFDHDEQPDEPTLTVPAPLTATFLEWNRKQERSRSKKTPTIWQGVVRVLWPQDQEVPVGATLTIAVPTHPDFVVTLEADSPRPPAPETNPAAPPDGR
jgi:hypothetical protein